MIDKQPIFRKIKNDEKKIIISSLLKSFGDTALEALKNYHFWMKEGKIKEVFIVHKESIQILDKITQRVYSAGIPFGSFLNSIFQLEIEGSAILASSTKKTIHVKTDQFLFGKPIFIENIKEVDEDFVKGDILLVFGRNNLHYGVGHATIDSTEIPASKSNTIIIKGYKNKPLDRGWYLRGGN